MTFLIDTGSSWTWLPNADCPKDQCKNNIYQYQKSYAYKVED